MPDDNNGKGCLLIVEDDPGMMELERQRLSGLGLEMVGALKAEEALEVVRRRPVEIAVLDYSLPGMTGLDLVSRIREQGLAVPPFIVATGRGGEKVAVETMKGGALDYIVKDSAFLDNLLPTVSKALERSGLQRKLKRTEADLRKSVRIYNVLAQVNQAAARASDPGELLRKVCRIAVEAGGLRMAWVGALDPDIKRFVPFCSDGFVDGYLDKIKIPLGDDEGNGPTGTAFKSGGIVVCSDIASDPRMAPWREAARARGYASSSAIPLFLNGKIPFVLSLYAAEKEFFSREELQLLAEIQGDISLALGALKNEEKRAAAQASLERTAAELSHVMESTQVMLIRARAASDGKRIPEWVSGDTVAITGYEAAEILDPAWLSAVLHPEDRKRVRAEKADILRTGSTTQDFRIKRKDGSVAWIHSQFRATPERPGELIGSWTDITTMKNSEARFQTLIDAAPYGVVVRKGTRVTYINKSGMEIMRSLREEDYVGRDILERITAKYRESVAGRIAAVDKGAVLPPMEIEVTAMDGERLSVEISSRRLLFGSEGSTVVFFHDVSERKKSGKLMLEMSAMQRVESLGQLAGGIAHDFNNMLTGIMGNISLLEVRCAKDAESVAIIKDTLQAACNAQILTTNLLAFSKGGKPIKKEVCVEKMLSDIFTLATRGANAAAELDVPAGLWSVDGDENQLKQAVNNMLMNGLQAMPSGGTIRLEARNLPAGAPLPGVLPGGAYVRITVSDTGIGIPGEYLSHVFEPYFSTKEKGHGLGLFMAWSVVKNHGGHIELASEPGKGTRFELFLPAMGRCLAAPGETARKPAGGTGRVLVLEDEEIVINAVRRMLMELGYENEIVRDGAEAVRRYREEQAAGRPFSAVIMDLTIPGGMGGKAAVMELRKTDPAAKVIVSSGYSDDAELSDYRESGFDAMLPKPYRFKELADTLAKLLDGKN